MGDQPVFCLLLDGEFSTTGLLVGLSDIDTFKRKTNKAQVLQQFAAFGQWI
jgi:hypothetical protein